MQPVVWFAAPFCVTSRHVLMTSRAPAYCDDVTARVHCVTATCCHVTLTSRHAVMTSFIAPDTWWRHTWRHSLRSRDVVCCCV